MVGVLYIQNYSFKTAWFVCILDGGPRYWETKSSPNQVNMKQEPTLRHGARHQQQQHQPLQQQVPAQQHLSPPLQPRYVLPNPSGILPAPAHMGFLPSSQSQLHLSTHPLPAHLPTFLQQGAAFTVPPSHAAYLTHASIMGGLPTAATASAAAPSLGISRTNRQPAFPSYLYSSFEWL